MCETTVLLTPPVDYVLLLQHPLKTDCYRHATAKLWLLRTKRRPQWTKVKVHILHMCAGHICMIQMCVKYEQVVQSVSSSLHCFTLIHADMLVYFSVNKNTCDHRNSLNALFSLSFEICLCALFFLLMAHLISFAFSLSWWPHKHTPISWPAEPCKEVWTGEVRRREKQKVHHQGEPGGRQVPQTVSS